MKKVLSLLVSFVFLQTQSWALSGGPQYGGDAASFTGTYAGVLIPESDEDSFESSDSSSSASIGLFSLDQPSKGFATGVVIAFVNGAVFNGTIQGIIDPLGGVLNGVIDAQSAFQVVELVPTIDPTTGARSFVAQSFSVFAEGNINATVQGGSNSGNGSRIRGTASLDVFFSILNDGTPEVTQTARFLVDGFKQIDPLTGL